MIRLLIDRDIPFIKGIFEPYAEVIYLNGREMDCAKVKDADALIIRTRTRCNKALLSGSNVRAIATATIGYDHIDTDWCQTAGIKVMSAPGCNSEGVMRYFYTALHNLAKNKSLDLTGKCIGVIGVGNVGKKVVEMGQRLGFEMLLNDPPRERLEGSTIFTPLDELLSKSDIVTLHIPLDAGNRNFANADFFGKMKDNAIFVNASRGEVVDEYALLSNVGRFGGIVLDVWRNEPVINTELLNVADIATPHIAGYSKAGKINATVSVVRGIAHFFDIAPLKDFAITYQEDPFDLDSYDIMADDKALRAAPETFERLRQNYAYR